MFVDVRVVNDFGDASTALAIAIAHDEPHQLENVLVGCRFAGLLSDDTPLGHLMLATGLVKPQGYSYAV